jgi:TnpA family transposase
LDNETDLPLHEHTTDTAGYTEKVFALFDGLGFLFSPRIRDLKDQKIYCIDKDIKYKNLNDLLGEKLNVQLILNQWDNFLRVLVSLKYGWVTASLYLSKIQSYPRQSKLAKAIQELW